MPRDGRVNTNYEAQWSNTEWRDVKSRMPRREAGFPVIHVYDEGGSPYFAPQADAPAAKMSLMRRLLSRYVY